MANTQVAAQKPRMALHLQCPIGHWRVICRHRQFNLRAGERFIFSHTQERRS